MATGSRVLSLLLVLPFCLATSAAESSILPTKLLDAVWLFFPPTLVLAAGGWWFGVLGVLSGFLGDSGTVQARNISCFAFYLMISSAAVAWLSIPALWVFFFLGRYPTAGWIVLFPFGYGSVAFLAVYVRLKLAMKSAREEKPEPRPRLSRTERPEKTSRPGGEEYSAEVEA